MDEYEDGLHADGLWTDEIIREIEESAEAAEAELSQSLERFEADAQSFDIPL